MSIAAVAWRNSCGTRTGWTNPVFHSKSCTCCARSEYDMSIAQTPIAQKLTGDFHADLTTILPRLRIYALSLTRDPDRADDLVQQTVVKSLAGRQSFRPGTNFAGWLFRIQRNEFISGLRRQRPTVPMDDAIANTLSHPPPRRAASSCASSTRPSAICGLPAPGAAADGARGSVAQADRRPVGRVDRHRQEPHLARPGHPEAPPDRRRVGRPRYGSSRHGRR